MRTLLIYEKAMPCELSWPKKLKAAKEAGFDGVEISVDESDGFLSRLNWSFSERQELFCLSHEMGVAIYSMCLSGHRRFPLGSYNNSTSGHGLKIMEKAIDLASDLGVRIIQLAGYDVYYEPSTQHTVDRFIKNLRISVDMAASRGVMLAFETMETPFMNTVQKAMKYVDLINSPYLNIYPDIGNLTNGTEDVFTDLLKGSGHIVAAHLKETTQGVYRDLRFGEGRVDFPKIISQLNKQGVFLYTAEFWYHPGEDWRAELSYAHDFLRPSLEGY